MTREQFKRNLLQSIERKDQDVSEEDIERFLSLNFDEDSSISNWTFDDFYDFSVELCNNYGDFWETVRDFDLHTPDKHYKVRTTYIDYDISEEDVELPDPFESYGRMDIEEYSSEEIEDMIDELKNSLPQVLEFEVDCQEDELDEIISDLVSDETGYLINEVDYNVLEEYYN